jgi:hypothetical protein
LCVDEEVDDEEEKEEEEKKTSSLSPLDRGRNNKKLSKSVSHLEFSSL